MVHTNSFLTKYPNSCVALKVALKSDEHSGITLKETVLITLVTVTFLPPERGYYLLDKYHCPNGEKDGSPLAHLN